MRPGESHGVCSLLRHVVAADAVLSGHRHNEQLEHDWEGRRQLKGFESENCREVATTAGRLMFNRD